MNNLIIAQNYETFGEEGLTSNKVIYYKEDNMVKFRANITDNPFGESEVVTVNGGMEAVYLGESDTWNVPSNMTTIPNSMFYTIKTIKAVYTTPNTNKIDTYAFDNSSISRYNSDEEGTADLSYINNLQANVFRNTPNIKKVIISNQLTYISVNSLTSYSIEIIDFGNTRTTIPTIVSTSSYSANTKFVVPDSLYDQWIVAPVWSNYAENIIRYTEYKYNIKLYDYVESTVINAYIDTDYKPNQDTKLEIKYLVKSYNNNAVILGCCEGTPKINNAGNGLIRIQSNTSSVNRVGFGNGEGTTVDIIGYSTNNTVYTVKFDNNKVYIDDNLVATLPTSTWTANYSLWLFGRNTAGVLGFPFLGNIYYCKIWENDTLVRDYKPCLYNNQAGLWDSVECKFYGNANNTGTLTVGNDE